MTAIVDSLPTLRRLIADWREQGETIGFVPTMGNLHAGHLRLVEVAQQQCSKVIVSIFVNPTQFGPHEDFEHYPRTFQADHEKLTAQLTDAVFVPAVSDIYPEGLNLRTAIEVLNLADELCGASRPGHFRGVATVVAKLFNLVPADKVFFGEKDFQQLTVIKQMVADLCMPIEVIGVPTVRAPSGLALSSRNQYLTEQERQTIKIYSLLCEVRDKILAGKQNYAQLCLEASNQLKMQGMISDYFSVRRQADLKLAEPNDKKLVVLTAARIGNTRLIDNVLFEIT